jgi:hypothetical protein
MLTERMPAARLHALDPVHRDLHHRVEVLHAEARAVEADRPQFRDIRGVDEPGVQLDRDIGIVAVGEVELAAQGVHHLAQLGRRQDVRGAAAEVQLDDLAVAVEQRRHQVDLAVQARQVAFGAALVAGDDAVAAAVEAGAGAEGHVHVQRQPARDRVAVAGRNGLAQLGLAERRAELRGRGVGGVARPGPVVAAQQVGVELWLDRHASHTRRGPLRTR